MTRGLALALTVLTGFSGLVYEVVWQKYLATLLGSHSEATAAVLAIFLGGLAVGYSVFGRTTTRFVDAARSRGEAPRLFFLYGGVEATIGLWAIVFPLLFQLARALSVRVHPDSEVLAFSLDLLLTAALIGPPTILMGGTIPILTQALAQGLDDATRVHAWIYACNTAGAFVGALAGGFVLVPLLGLDGALSAMGTINLLAGATFLALQRSARALPGGTASGPGEARPAVGFASYAVVVLLAGFAMMAIQTVLNRVGGLAFGASHFTFAMVVAVFVLCIALGSFAVSALPRIPPALIVGSQWALVALLALLYLALDEAPYYAHVLRSLFRDQDAGFHVYHGLAFLGILAVLAAPIGISGALLPLLFHHLRHEAGDLGAVAGRLYSWNTAGSLLGAILGGYALLFWFDLHHVYTIAVAALAVGASILTSRVLGVRAWASAMAGGAALAALGALPPWDPDRLAVGSFRLREPIAATYAGPRNFFVAANGQVRTLFHDDDPTHTVTVREGVLPSGQASRSIVTNGKPDGNLHSDYPTMALIALLPALFAEDLASTFVIGWGTGVTVGELAALDDTREITVAEISRGVMDAAPFFDLGNLNASRSPKVRVVRADAYRALLRSEGRYGAIVSEPSNPWGVGVEMLFSEEFLRAARSRLAPGGVYVQWMHTYEIDEATVELVLRTYARVFDHVAVWFTTGPDLLLLGFDSDARALDLARLARRFERPDLAAGFRRAGLTSLESLLAHELLPLDTLRAARLEGPVHTLRHPILSHQAARAFFRGQLADLPRLASREAAETGRRNSLWRRHLGSRADAPTEDELEALAWETCRRGRYVECATVHGRWRRDFPSSTRLAASVEKAGRLGRIVREQLDDELLGGLAALVRPGEKPAVAGVDLAVAATKATELFATYYLHSLPFDRQALAAEWRRCEARRRPVGPCLRGREQAERQLGSLAPVQRTQ